MLRVAEVVGRWGCWDVFGGGVLGGRNWSWGGSAPIGPSTRYNAALHHRNKTFP